MLTKLFLMGRRRGELSPEELQALESTISTVATFRAGEVVVRAGRSVSQSTLLLKGLVSRDISTRAGDRQIVGLHVPGDFLDLHGYPLRVLDHDVMAICPVEVALAPHTALTRITDHHPHLTRMLWFSTLLDAAIHREWVFRNSRLSAVKRIAHLTCELNARLESVGLSEGGHFTLPLTQIDLGDACGLTSVHVNRVLRELRERKLMTFRSARVDILDRAALEQMAEFDESYLYRDEVTDRRGRDGN